MKNYKYIFIAILAIMALFGCNKNDLLQDAQNSVQKAPKPPGNVVEIDLERPHGEMVLGNVINNPFSVENMQIAKKLMYKELDSLNKLFGITKEYLDNFQVETTDLYVRFLPKNMEEILKLEADTNLITFPYPLHREIIKEGDYYIDEGLPEDLIWLYAVVPNNYCLNMGVEYEVLEQLFLPEHSPQFPLYQEWLFNEKYKDIDLEYWHSGGLTPLEKDFIDALTNAAFRAAGLEKEYGNNPHSQCEGSKIYAQGRVFIKTPKDKTGLSGVQIKISRWYRADKVYTDGAGYFYDSKAWSKNAWASEWINYTVIMNGKRGNNSWQFRKIPFVLTHSYFMGAYSMCEIANFTIKPAAKDIWGICVQSNAVYDFCLNAQNDGMTLPPNKLQIGSWYAEGSGDMSAPLFQQGTGAGWKTALYGALMAGAPTATALFFPITTSLAFPVIVLVVAISNVNPDLLVNYSDDIKDYEYMTTGMWHELTHSSHFNCIKHNVSNSSAISYWNAVMNYEIDHTLDDGNPYGKKGDTGWERIALTEGWGAFREWYLGMKYLNYNILDPDPINSPSGITYFTDQSWGTAFNYEYAGMFQELRNANCSLPNLEKSLTASTIKDFKTKLLSLEPTSRHPAINAIMSNY